MYGQPDARVQALIDQMMAAHRDVADLIGWVAPDRGDWRKVDTWTAVSIDDMLARALSESWRSARVCPHASASLLGGAPQPQVLDPDRGILACLEVCYLRLVTTTAADPAPARAVRCFDCGRSVGSRPLDNLLVGYGPVLIVASLCHRCDRSWLPAPRSAPEGS
jgi:hypothetical protein